ncbi:MAG TPA: hypothetical protein QF882_08870, partial [Arenicellales bacterium]|nr:hypothetical protein [Arenicellales bacterium]
MNFSMLRAKSGVFALVILLCAPLPSYAVEYCVSDFYGGTFGPMSFDVATDDDTDTATVEIVAGYARGWELTGSWDGEAGLG